MSTKLKFDRQDSFKRIIILSGTTYQHFDLNSIPKNFGCHVTQDGKEGIPSFINHKGLTYYLKN